MASRMENSAAQLPVASTQLSSIHSGAESQQEQRHKLLAMCQRHELTDVVLLLQSEPLQTQDEAMDDIQEVAAHRVILATASPFFHALFTSGMKESQEISPRVPLPGVPVAAFKELLRYMYIGELRVSGDTILSVLHAANRLELQEVVEICCKQLMLELNVNSCVDIYMCCEQLRMRTACRLLAQAARAMIDTYFCDVYQSGSFQNLSLDAVMKVLRQKNFTTNDTAVKSYDPMTKHKLLSEVLQLPIVRDSVGDLDDAVQMNLNSGSAMVNSRERRSLESVEDTMDVDTGSVLAREIEDNVKHQLTPTVFAIGGFNNPGALNTVEYLDFHRAAVMQERSNSILVFGGESRHGARMNTSERLDLNSGLWSDVDAFADCRSGHVAFSFLNESFVFCLGGSNKKDEYLDAVHRYDYLSKQWSFHSQMRAQRCGLNVAVVKTSRYAECFAVQKQREQQLHNTSSCLLRKNYQGNAFAQGA
ncbi:hypothetical protein JG687_00007909 [Phytophthora cactorum]|uniref:BTB domain-containing protein n=1 Tax=Phytophthora cactorum TaxID=29920 RepID=A0A8T1UFQ1_9STRA|nr:hypothetical protein JG687_00007909 [Phytophthora cactorum]